MGSAIRRDAIAIVVVAAASGLICLLPPVNLMHGWSIDVLTALRWEVFGPRRDPKTSPAVVIAVDEGVVALPTAVEADALFATFAQQWNRCNGKTADYRSQSYKITDVRVADSVLAATVQTSPTPIARAIGVRVNCVVEVKVPFSNDRGSPDRTQSADPETRAIDIARLMMEKVSKLS
jgi:hypothetical protein